MKSFVQSFDRMVVINLPRRADKLRGFFTEWNKLGYSPRSVEVFPAVDGTRLPMPETWSQGRGAWGCMQTYKRLLEDVLQGNDKSVLIMEDDVCFADGFMDSAGAFLGAVPAEWDHLMFGGEILPGGRSVEVAPGVRRLDPCIRTHCHALQGRFIAAAYKQLQAAHTHSDVALSMLHKQFRAYSPFPFIAGQREALSDLTGKTEPRRFWQESHHQYHPLP